MNIDTIIANKPDIQVQTDALANAGRQKPAGDNTALDDKAYLNSLDRSVSVSKQDGTPDTKKSISNQVRNIQDLKAVLALDDDKNVVIRVLDEKGKTVAQYPPEDYLQMMKRMNEIVKSLFSKKV